MIDNKAEKTNECVICRNELPEDLNKSSDSKLNHSKCDHVLCQECILSYLKHEINENKLPVKCPGEKCKLEIEPSFIMQIFKSNEKILNKYLNFTLLKNKEISWCPTPDCNYGFIWKNDDPKFSCPKCKKVYCLKCQCEYHYEGKCGESKKKEDSDKAEKEFLNLARQSKFKQCPECKRWIEKNEGCNHITCYVCKYEFCYICGKKYSHDHGNCEYEFIEPAEIAPEIKVNSEVKKNKKAKNEINEKLGFDPILNSRTRAAIVNQNNNDNEDNSDNFNSFVHYNDLVNSIFVNSSGKSSMRDNEPEYWNTSKFNDLRDSRLNEEHLQSFFSTTEPIGINRSKFGGPLKKDGTPDMRFAVNKNAEEKESITGSVSTNAKTSYSNFGIFSVSNEPSVSYSSGPLKKDGTPDMRYAVNKNAQATNSFSKTITNNFSNCDSSIISSSYSSSGPTKKDGTLDMRYAVNKTAKANDSYSGSYSNFFTSNYSNDGYNRSSIGTSYSFASSYSNIHSGPTKKDGTLDMRFSVNKESCSNYGNSISGSNYSSNSFSRASGPLRKDGKPDMRYAVNKAAFGGKRK